MKDASENGGERSYTLLKIEEKAIEDDSFMTSIFSFIPYLSPKNWQQNRIAIIFLSNIAHIAIQYFPNMYFPLSQQPSG